MRCMRVFDYVYFYPIISLIIVTKNSMHKIVYAIKFGLFSLNCVHMRYIFSDFSLCSFASLWFVPTSDVFDYWNTEHLNLYHSIIVCVPGNMCAIAKAELLLVAMLSKRLKSNYSILVDAKEEKKMDKSLRKIFFDLKWAIVYYDVFFLLSIEKSQLHPHSYSLDPCMHNNHF